MPAAAAGRGAAARPPGGTCGPADRQTAAGRSAALASVFPATAPASPPVGSSGNAPVATVSPGPPAPRSGSARALSAARPKTVPALRP